MNTELSTKVQEIIQGTLEKMNFSEVDIVQIDSGNEKISLFNIVTQVDSKFLIGQHGDNLKALQHILRLIVRKTFVEERVDFLLDVNNYRRERDGAVLDIARSAAREATMDKKAVVLREMSPYERRLVHMELAENPEVVTESIGQDDGRKVVVKPADFLDTL